MKIFSVAINTQYEIEVLRLQRSVSTSIVAFTKHSKQYKEVNTDPLINGLWHKCNFANYIEKTDESIVFMDADMFSLKQNPFKDFIVKVDTDFAYVPYEGIWHFPDVIRQSAFDHHGHKINSGFMYFRNLEIAQSICTSWSDEFLKRPLEWIKNEYDEYALMIALMKLNFKVELLDKKWNNWELSTKEEIMSSDSTFIQSHNFLDIV